MGQVHLQATCRCNPDGMREPVHACKVSYLSLSYNFAFQGSAHQSKFLEAVILEFMDSRIFFSNDETDA